MTQDERQSKSFLGVSLFVIVLGAAIFAFGLISWIMNYLNQTNMIAFPSLKIMGGLVILAMGYIILELELIRKK